MHDFLSPRRQKHLPTRIFLANSFLSNISLDGTHRDTKYRALVELYKKDAAEASSSSETICNGKEDKDIMVVRLEPSSSTKIHNTKSKSKVKVLSIRRSNSMRSARSRRSESMSSSSESIESLSSSSSEEEKERDYDEFPIRESKLRLRHSSSKTEKSSDADEVSQLRKSKKHHKRRCSSASYSKGAQTDIMHRREKASRTISGSSIESNRGTSHVTFVRSGSASPSHTVPANLMFSSPPVFGPVDDSIKDGSPESIEVTLAEVLGMPGEILDSHRGIITERKDFSYTSTVASHWPIVQTCYLSKYRVEQLDEEVVEKHEVIGRTLLTPIPSVSLIQKISAKLARINSSSSVGSSRSGRSAENVLKSLVPSRRPWLWTVKSPTRQVEHHPSMRPRRISSVHSIHVETEAEALENLLGVKLTNDPEDDLSYENLLVPLTWIVDYTGDLTPEEAKNLLNTGEISVMSKLLGPAHPNSFDENYVFGKLLRRDYGDNQQRQNSSSAETSVRSSQEPNKDKHFAADGYRPGILDDPEWETAVRRQNLYLESYFSSIIANDLEPEKKKEALNELFRSKFPNIQLSFSKFKSIKRDMQKACTDHQVKLDLAVVAFSYVYFEKLILKGFINKPNRKILASVCIVLAAKMNDLSKEEHGELFDSIESQLRVERTEVNAFEFAVMVALAFDLHVPIRYVRYHYDILAKRLENLPTIYAVPLAEPCLQIPKRVSISLRPIRQISLPGFNHLASHRINSRPATRRA